jgi:hypothetical protein
MGGNGGFNSIFCLIFKAEVLPKQLRSLLSICRASDELDGNRSSSDCCYPSVVWSITGLAVHTAGQDHWPVG